ncbi:IclR family transcriptional regulator [Sphingomonas sp. RIT328]|uniref:IclR family transcriptional regulator n=1 Tax=Sphingomonas sp. RIT328 TaxID=1470591 RepID=UPI00044C489D|nr:IclR family transcriptional regulator [Sphingomonas sp. RIT328]EZP50451.1 Regulatory protein, IclR [Sphingomonas sp. RIT328]
MPNRKAARPDDEPTIVGAGSQTLMRGLDLIEALIDEQLSVAELAERLGLNKSTTYRLAAALTDRGYLAATPRAGYRLGPKLLALGSAAQEQVDIIQIARPVLEDLAARTEDTVHLGVLDADQALYLDKVAGRRRVVVSSRVGDRHPLTSTGLGKALMLDHDAGYWKGRLAVEQGSTARIWTTWHGRMADYVQQGRAFDLEENEDRIRCIAAPVRDVRNRIVAAISVSSAAHYMDDARMATLSADVMAAAAQISQALGNDSRLVARR